MDPILILAGIGYATFSSILILGVWLTRREVKKITAKAIPLMEKADAALEHVGDIEAVPAVVVHGIEKVLQDQLATQGSPLRAFTSAAITEATTALSETLMGQLETIKKVIPAASTILQQRGVSAHVDKTEGRKMVEEMVEGFGPFKGLIEKFVPKSKREDPLEFIAYLGEAKAKIAAFAPGIGAQLDGLIEQMILGGGVPGVGGMVKLLPQGAAEASSTADYMRS